MFYMNIVFIDASYIRTMLGFEVIPQDIRDIVQVESHCGSVIGSRH